MAKKDLQDKIVKYLADNGEWMEKATLLNHEWKYDDGIRTYMPNTADRELRSAESGEDGESRIAVKADPNSKSIVYKFIPPEYRNRYIPFSQRNDQTILFREIEDVPKKQRTLKQNDALHLYLSMLANELNDSGNDMRKVLKPTVDIPWSTDTCKRFLWKPIQEIMMDKKSTTELTTDEVDKIYKVLDRHVSEKCHIHVEFPSVENTDEFINSLENMK